MSLRALYDVGDLDAFHRAGGTVTQWFAIQEQLIELAAARAARSTPRGIPPLAKSKMGEYLWVTPFQGYAGFTLPGNGLPYGDDSDGGACGEILRQKTKGCLEASNHTSSRFGADVVGKIFIKLFARTCFRAECPTCYESWAGRLAGRIEHRIESYIAEHSPRSQAIHFIASVPKSAWGKIDAGKYTELRRDAYKLAMRAGLRGGMVAFHPFRIACTGCGREKPEGRKSCPVCGGGVFSWYLSPHFHFIGIGWITGVKEINEETGWVLRNLGVRSSISATALYILSHCGVKKEHHTIAWFGVMGYRNFHAEKQKAEKPTCPLCGDELRPVAWAGVGDWPIPQPEQARGYFLEPRSGWVYTGVVLIGH